MQAATRSFGGKACAKLAVGGHPAGDEDTRGANRFGSGKGLLHQVADDRVLKTGNEIERGLRAEGQRFFASLRRAEVGKHATDAGLCFGTQAVQFDVAQHGGLDSRK